MKKYIIYYFNSITRGFYEDIVYAKNSKEASRDWTGNDVEYKTLTYMKEETK